VTPALKVKLGKEADRASLVAVQLGPSVPGFLTNRAAILDELGTTKVPLQWIGASFTTSIQTQRTRGPILGRSQSALHRFREAETSERHAILLDSLNSGYWLNLADIRFAGQNYRGASAA